jgi:hypothetical protein
VTRNRLQQYKASLAYELNRFGFSLDYATHIDQPLLEIEADKIYATTDKEAVCADVYRTVQALWELRTRKMSSRDLMHILHTVGA